MKEVSYLGLGSDFGEFEPSPTGKAPEFTMPEFGGSFEYAPDRRLIDYGDAEVTRIQDAIDILDTYFQGQDVMMKVAVFALLVTGQVPEAYAMDRARKVMSMVHKGVEKGLELMKAKAISEGHNLREGLSPHPNMERDLPSFTWEHPLPSRLP